MLLYYGLYLDLTLYLMLNRIVVETNSEIICIYMFNFKYLRMCLTINQFTSDD